MSISMSMPVFNAWHPHVHARVQCMASPCPNPCSMHGMPMSKPVFNTWHAHVQARVQCMACPCPCPCLCPWSPCIDMSIFMFIQYEHGHEHGHEHGLGHGHGPGHTKKKLCISGIGLLRFSVRRYRNRQKF
jgi:hypothetical protein